MGKLLIGLVLGIVLTVGLPLLFLGLGMFDVSARRGPGFIERNLAHMTVDACVEKRAPETSNPLGQDPAVLREGLEHYESSCVLCHAAPGLQPSEFARGLSPSAPMLDSRGTQASSDGELFWTVKNGIRMSGMPAFGPTHQDEEIWEMVAFVRHLPSITPDEKEHLRAALEGAEGEHHHAGEESEESEESED